MTISIKDIAKEMNISFSTVSRALNNSPRIKSETREQIQRKATEMGYLPSAVARSLVTRRTNTIGVVVTQITDLFLVRVRSPSGRVVEGVVEASGEVRVGP
jgi:DNA-binding LacI/PurR family transcriptional regulator